jgi:glycine cleavage system regulatory protein
MKPLIFTLVGPDKPGLISNLSKAVFERGGNWLGSNFSHMAGHFAGFVHIDLPENKHDELIELFKQHPDLRIHLVSAQTTVISGQQTAQINIMGNDKAGIVQELTKVLNQFNLNIVQFDSTCTSAPNSGSPLFKAKTIVEIAPEVELTSLREALENIANDLMVDVELV